MLPLSRSTRNSTTRPRWERQLYPIIAPTQYKQKKKKLYHLEGKIGHKYTHNDVQNEISDIMAVLTLQEKLKTIRERRFFSVIADKGTDVSTVIVLSTICGWKFECFQRFQRFLPVDTIVHVIKYIFIRMNLSLSNCRGKHMKEHRTWWGRNLEFRLRFLHSSQKPLPYTVKDILSAYQWNQWLKNVRFCMMSWVLLEKFAYSWSFHQNENIF